MQVTLRTLFLVFFISSKLAYSQTKNNKKITNIFYQFENELLFSHDKASATAKYLIEEASNQNTEKSEALIQSIKAIVFLKINNEIDSAKIYAKSAYKLHEKLKDSEALFKDIHTLYECYDRSAENDSTFIYATKEIDLAERLNNPSFKTTAYIDMSDVYYFTKQHKKVITYRKKALDIAEKHNLKKQLADIHIKIAQSHLRLSKQRTKKALDSAIFYGRKALEYAKEVNYNYGVYESSVRLADFLNVNNQHKEALSLIETVITIPKEKRPVSFNFTAPFYYAVILKDNAKYNNAKNIVKQLVSNLKPEDYSRKQSLNFFLSVLYAYNKQPDSTDYAIKQAVIATGAISEARINEKIAELQTKYETDIKEKEIKNLEQKKRLKELEVKDLQRQRLILLFSLLIPITIIIAGGWYVNRRRLKLQLETEQKEYAKQMSELKALRSQMNPHFIFNALNSIQEYIFANEKKLASSYLVKFSRLIRMYLDQSRMSEITLAKEIEALKLYLYLEDSRFSNTLNYSINVDRNLDIDIVLVPSLFIQPYVENAIKHGLLNKKDNKKLDISFNINNAELQVSVKDNGIGIEASKKINENRPYKSFATEANLNRVELMNFKRVHKIKVSVNDLSDTKSNDTGTEVLITIPIEK